MEGYKYSALFFIYVNTEKERVKRCKRAASYICAGVPKFAPPNIKQGISNSKFWGDAHCSRVGEKVVSDLR